jgi:predicted nucleic acid-binding protein
VDTTAELIDSAIEIKHQWKYSFYDSLIIVGALACDAKTLYSEDLQHGQRIENLTIINLFI